jgi:phosphoribosyl 1,2-cyclic phosphate phosphodiesterase
MALAKFTLLGVGTSTGVPRLGCSCKVCSEIANNPKNRRQRVAALLEVDGKKLLIDAGPDIRNQLLNLGIKKVDALYITHNHFDHIACIDDVKCCMDLGKESIPLYANRPTYAELKKRIGYLLKPVAIGLVPPFYLVPLKKWEAIDFHGVSIQTLCYTQQNEGHNRPTFVSGFRIKNLAFLTDIKQYSKRLIQQLKGVETLVVGAVRDGESIAHFTFDEAKHFAQLIQAKKTIFIHLDHTVDYAAASSRLSAGLELGYDGYQIEFAV